MCTVSERQQALLCQSDDLSQIVFSIIKQPSNFLGTIRNICLNNSLFDRGMRNAHFHLHQGYDVKIYSFLYIQQEYVNILCAQGRRQIKQK